jgi:hypothetical protein
MSLAISAYEAYAVGDGTQDGWLELPSTARVYVNAVIQLTSSRYTNPVSYLVTARQGNMVGLRRRESATDTRADLSIWRRDDRVLFSQQAQTIVGTAALQYDTVVVGELPPYEAGDKYVTMSLDGELHQGSGVGEMEGFYSVKSYLAVGDGSTDDTEAIQDAIDAAAAVLMAGNSGIYGSGAISSGTQPMIYFPPGVYRVTASLTLPSYVRVFADQAIIVAATDDFDVFTTVGYNAMIDGIAFRRGRTALKVDTNDAAASIIKINNCEFIEQQGPAIETSSDSITTTLEIQGCKFYQATTTSNVLKVNSCDNLILRDSWVTSASTLAFRVLGGTVTLQNVDCTPLNTTGRWLSAEGGNLLANACRFGDENGGGKITLKCSTGPHADGISHVAIRDCEINGPNIYAFEFYDIPNVVSIKGNAGFLNSKGFYFDATIPTASKRDIGELEQLIVEGNSLQISLVDKDSDAFTTAQVLIQDRKHRSNTLLLSDVVLTIPPTDQTSYGAAVSSSNTTNSTSTNLFGHVMVQATATADGGYYSQTYSTALNSLANGPYTLMVEIECATNPAKVQIQVSDTLKTYDLDPGRHVLSIPIQIGASTSSRMVGISRITTMKSGDVVRIGLMRILRGRQASQNTCLQMFGTAAPTTLYWYVGDIVHNTSPTGGSAQFWNCIQSGVACSTNWARSTLYNTVGTRTASQGNVYEVTTGGTSADSGTGPSGTGSSITDGTVVWKYLAPQAIFRSVGGASLADGRCFNVLDYGAIPSNPYAGALNVTAFNTAITAANSVSQGTVLVPNGPYYIGSTIEIYQKHGISLRGSCERPTIYNGAMVTGTLLVPDATFTIGDPMVRIRGSDGCCVENLKIHGGGVWNSGTAYFTTKGRAGCGVELEASVATGPTRCNLIKDCTFQGFGCLAPTTWQPDTGYTAGQYVVNGSTSYECITAGTSASSGGPTGTSDDITDGTVHWRWVDAYGWGIRMGSTTNYQVDLNHVYRCAFLEVANGLIQHGTQTVHNWIEKGIVGSFTDFGFDFRDGDVRLRDYDFQGGGLAGVNIRGSAYWAHLIDLYSEITRGTGYRFPTSTSRNYPTRIDGCRILWQQEDPDDFYLVDYKQTGTVLCTGCTWTSSSMDDVGYVFWDGQSGASPPSIIEQGCEYLQAIRPMVSTVCAYQSPGTINPLNPLTEMVGSWGSTPATQADYPMLRTKVRLFESELWFEDTTSSGYALKLRSVNNSLRIRNQLDDLVMELGAGGQITRPGSDNTTPGTSATINQVCGSFTLAAGQGTFTLSSNRISTASILDAVPDTNDATLGYLKAVTITSGQAVIRFSGTATANCKINFKITNKGTAQT